MNDRDYLLGLVEKLLNSDMSVPEFERLYYDYYLENVPDGALTDYEQIFFGFVQEKLDWVSQNPNLEEKKYGWLDHESYVDWLQGLYFSYKKGMELK